MNQEHQQAIKILRNEGVIIYPTETVLGIGCKSLSIKAISNIYAIKKRDPNKAMLVLVSSLEMIHRYKKHLDKLEHELLLSNEPTTVIIDHVNGFPPELTGKNNSLAFRITKHTGCLKLIEAIDQPLVSTSANVTGEPTAISHKNIPEHLKKKVDFILKDESVNNSSKPSRIVKVINNSIQYIRK